jgi:hypothetical protein
MAMLVDPAPEIEGSQFSKRGLSGRGLSHDGAYGMRRRHIM